MEWLTELNDQRATIAAEELPKWLEAAESLGEGGLWLGRDGGLRPWWHRFLGLQARYVDPLVSLEWYSNAAALIFHDENWSEYRALSLDTSELFSEEVRARISHGEPKPTPQEECVTKSLAFRAVREAAENLVRPSWLEYRFVE